FTGSVTNTGNVPLTNVTIFDDRVLNTGTNFVVGYPLLTNGEVRNFSGSYAVPTNVCSVSDTLTARGTNICTGARVSATATPTGPVATHPKLALTKACPVTPPAPGQTLNYTGTITNVGDVAITNITLTDSIFGTNTAAPTPALIARLEPGQGTNFSGS